MKRTITFLMLLLMAGLAMAQGTFTCGDPVIDGSGNVYETVKINGLCWTKSNMRAVSYADGSPIANAMIYNSNLHPDTTANLANFGRLYTWWSAVNLPEGSDAAPAKDATGFVRGVCPAGWHIPTVADIQKLRTYADEDLHSTDFWVMPNSNTNSTGFSEVPGGMFSAERNRFEGLLSNSYMWTDSSSRREWVVACNSRYFCDKASEEYVKKGDGLSVRCVFTMEICPLVTTLAADECDMKYTTAVLKGSATDLEGTLQEYGIVWGLTKNALTNTQLATSITNGNFEATLTGLPACGDTVYYSAFVKQSSCNEIVYGDTLMFVVCGHGQDAKPCLLAPTVTDHENNVYNTVQIGNQCWMRENLRTTTSPSTGNRLITDNSTDRTFTGKQARWYDNDSARYAPQNYGLLYNWNAAVDTFNSTYGEFSVNDTADYAVNVTFTGNRRGICPEGWHLPSDAEWDTLKKYVSSQSQYICGSKNSYIAKSLASTTVWFSSDSSCAVGNVLNTNNKTGFSAVPAGNNVGAQFNHRTYTATFWSSTQAEKRNATNQYMLFNSAEVNEHNNLKSYGFSVRCIKDACEDNAVNATLPTVTTSPVSCYNGNGATGGNVTDDGGAEITARGVCWSTNPNPTIADNHTSDSVGIGTFNSVITNLTPNIVYYVRAYATNVKGTAYGNEETYTRIADGTPCPCATKAYDHQGNDYNTVWIGCQCWTKENMRATTSPNGHLTFGGDSTSYTNAYYYDYATSTIPLKDRGLLYNWAGAMDTTSTAEIEASFTNRRGICPEGWHVPSGDEWYEMLYYVGSQRDYICGTDNGSPAVNMIAKALSSKKYWNSADGECVPGHDSTSNNKTGFSIVPAGYCHGSTYYKTNDYAALWSSRSNSGRHAQDRIIMMDFEYVGTFTQEYTNKYAGRSVRCIKDTCDNNAVSANLPTVTTKPVQCDWTTGGNVTDDGGAEVILRGVCWDTTSNPTIDDKHTVDGFGIGDFSSIVADMKVNKTYYVRAYAINSAGVAYGNEETYIYGASCPGTPTVTDHENNVYNTVKIGNQCWTRENMRCTTSPSGKIFNNATTDVSRLTPMFYNNTASAIAITERGMLYNWAAALDTVFTASTDASFTNRRGICPEGWHLPSRAEWQTLIDYTGTVECYTCGGDASAIAKSLAYNGYWANSNGACHIGNNLSSNNNTGFSAIPTGFGNLSSPFVDTLRTRFWSSTGNNTSTSFGMTVNYNMANVSVTSGYDQNFGFAVRCLKDVITTNCPTVTTTAATNVSSDSAKINGVVTNVSGTVENYGFVWGTSKNTITTTVNGTSVTAMTADGDFSSIIKGLTPCDTIWYAAFAKTSECGETVYGDTLTFKVPVAAPDYTSCGTVTDHEGNDYTTVKIGDQCWTRENMRCTTSPTGKTIQDGQNIIESNTNPYYYNNTSSSIPLRDRGIHYNYSAAMDTVITDNVAPKNHRGICPEGWHIPDSSEFAKLREYVKLQGCYICGGDENNITKSLASTTYWENDLGVCQVGYSPSSTNNATGFSVIPAGHATNVNGTATFHQEHRGASLWCSDSKQDKGHIFAIGYINGKEKMLDNPSEKSFGRSVRCLKNDDNISYDGQPCPGTPTVTDVDGNTYNTVQIGNQCWMKENLRTTKYADSTAITAGGSSVNNTVPYYYNTTFSNIDSVQRGYLYNWAAATRSASTRSNNPSNAQGICPTGWHLPSKAEWDTLTNYVSSIPEYLCDGTNANIAKALASKTGWSQSTTTCAVGNDTTANNKTGFSAVPVGRCLGSTLIEVGYEANFWSSTLHEDNFAFSRYLNFNNAKVLGGTDGRNYGLSVRCLKDADTTATDNCPVITRSGYSVGLKDSVALTGIANNIVGDVTDYGFVYGYSRDAINRVVNSTHPKVIIRQYTDMSILFIYKKLDSVPQCDSVYFVAFLKTDGCSETVYSDTVSFIIKPYPQSCGDVTDVDDNTYETVQLGSQCWMIENLRTKHFKDGTAIAQGTDTSFTIPYYYQPAPAEVTDYNFDYYGLYYNFASVESPKGICPEGWHVPTRSEWDTLSNYVRSQCAYVCGNNDNNFAKALSLHFGWKDSDEECAVGNNQSTNNITNFGAIPMGRYNADAAKFDGVGEYSYFWTSTGYGTNTHYELTNAWTTRILYNRPFGFSSQYTKTCGFPIRCLRDEATTPTVVIDSLSCPEAKTVTDHEGNVYATVKIGNQCWTRENLRTTTSPSTKTNLIPADGVDYTFTGKQARWYGNDSSQYAPLKYGLLYNWNAAVDTFNTTLGELNVSNNYDYAVSVTFNSHRRGICPEGWHVPSDAEWNTMEQTVSGSDWQDIYANTNGWRGSHAGKLASGDKWNYSLKANAPGDTSYSDRNKSGFSAFPVGKCYGSWSGEAGVNAYFWSSTQMSGSNGDAWSRQIGYYDVTVYRTNYFKCNGFSVRCVKDADTTATDNCPEIIQALYDRIEVDSVTLTGIANNIIGDVTDYGFVYGYSRDAINRVVNSTHPRVTISHYSEVSMFDYDKLDSVPQCGSVYFVAFLKTDGCSETVYSDTVSFIIKPYTQNCGTVTDADGNTYETVQLGSQCWMKSNLRTTKYADGTEITAGGDKVSASEAYYYDNTSSNIALEQRGYFYNWAAAMNGASSSNATPSGVQGICPDGWHLPSHAEWDALMNYVRSNSCYICGGNSENIAKALASTTGWENHNGTCRVGNDQILNNATEFSSVPAGNYYGTFQGLLEGTEANFWSSREDENDPNRAWCVLLRTYDKILNSSNNSKKYGYSIRCLKDADTLCAPEGDARPCPGTPTVTDHENNVYNTVQIGDQCWMKENMRCTTSPSGKTAFQAASGSSSYVSPQYYDSESSIPLNDRGLLYNWAAAMDTLFTSENEMNVSFINRRGICPEGWHVPTDNEWTVFENYVKSQDCYHCNDTSDYIAKALSSTKYWKEDDFMSCLVGNDLTKNNATGFSAIPAGMCRYPNYYLDSMQVSFWSSTSASDYGAYFRNIMSHERVVTREAGNDKNTSYSVRCLKDEVVVIDSLSCPEAKTVTDYEGNTYATVRIGNQCWTRQNMRATKYADGRSIPAGDGRSNTEPYYYNYTSSGIDLKDRGLLYNWTAAMDSAASSNAVPSGVQGICPTGWHVPSDAEWNLMEQTVSNDFGNWVEFSALRGSHAGKLAGGDKWQTSSNANAPGDTNYTDRNASGFSAVPAGYSFGSSFYYAGDEARFWTSTQYSDTRAWKRDLIYINTQVFRDYDDKYCGYSVRCLKDEVVVIDSLSCPEAKTVTDHENNVYATVKIGNQCWTRENLRTTTSPSTGTYLVTTNNTLTYTGKQARWYGYDSSQYAPLKYGLLYNWNAAVDTFNTTFGETSVNNVPVSVTFTGHRRGICPEGWHLPSNAEWDTLTTYVGNNLGANNATGFSAVLAGSHTGSFTGKNINAFFWSSTQDDSNTAWRRMLSNNNVSMGNSKLGKDNSFSVRCLKDEATTTTVVIDSLSCPEAKTVTDHEGNTYATVKIGKQCWTRQNLRTTTSPSTGTYLVTTNDTVTFTGKQARWYDNDSTTYAPLKYGLLYNWNAAVDTNVTGFGELSVNNVENNAVSVTFTGHRRGICPEGWHLPSYAEWDTLTQYVESQPQYRCDELNASIAKTLADTSGWKHDDRECAVGNKNDHPSLYNLTGFSAIPAGYYSRLSSFRMAGNYATFWVATDLGIQIQHGASFYYITHDSRVVHNYTESKSTSFSVRCVKDE